MPVKNYTDATVFKLIEINIKKLSTLSYKELRAEIDKQFLHKTFVGLKRNSGASKDTLFKQIRHALNTQLMTKAKRSEIGRILLDVSSKVFADNIVDRARSRQDKEVKADLSAANVLELTTIDRNKKGQPTVKLLKRLADSDLATRNSREVRYVQTRSAGSQAKWDAIAEAKGFSSAEASTHNLTSLSDIDMEDTTRKSLPVASMRRGRIDTRRPTSSSPITAGPRKPKGPWKPKGPKGPKSPLSPITSKGGPSKKSSSKKPTNKKSSSSRRPRRQPRRR